MSTLTPRGAATRTRVVAAAATLIYERGAAGTSLEDVMTASGTSKSQLYHYFQDKHALVLAVAQQQAEWVLAGQRQLLTEVESLAGLRRWRDAVVNAAQAQGCAGGCPLGSLAAELADADPACREVLAEAFTRWQALLTQAVDRMQSGGRLPAETDTAALAGQLLAAVQGGLLLARTRRSVTPLAQALDQVLDQVLSASVTGRRPAPPP